ncbi:hypothetical protein GCM10022419_034210 [Nonomuraea rosea]|uniref:Uncharacterized protein n=1 Tax=Nonomuraea rosea TaxID=638574 RepID=A0ABP6WJB7_9ACTN
MQPEDIQRLERIAGTCQDGDICPTIYRTDRGTIVVQGNELSAGSLRLITLPGGETVAEIPESLLLEAARALSA